MDIHVVRVDEKEPGAFKPLLCGYENAPAGTGVAILGCTVSDYAAGALVAYCYPEHIEIPWICVSDPYRRCGIAKTLLREFLNATKEGTHVEITVTKRPNSICIPELLLNSFDFTRKDSVPVYSFRLRDVVTGPLKPLTWDIPSEIVYRDQLNQVEWYDYRRLALKEAGDRFSMLTDRDISPYSALYIKDKKLKGCFLVYGNPDKTLDAALLYANGTSMIGGLISAVAIRLVEEYPQNTRIYAATHGDWGKKFLSSIGRNKPVAEAEAIRYVR